jgi:hypothetical protein
MRSSSFTALLLNKLVNAVVMATLLGGNDVSFAKLIAIK